MKNKDIIVITSKLEDIKRFETISKLSGYKVYFAENLKRACDMLEKFIPLAIIITPDSDIPPEAAAKEIKRFAPLLPLILALKSNKMPDEYRELFDDFMEFPWTEIELAKKLFSFENKKIIQDKSLNNKKIIKMIPLILLSLAIIIIPFIIITEGNKNNKSPENNYLPVKIPTSNISGFFSNANKLYIYDWLLESFYIYSKDNLEYISRANIYEIGTLIKDSGDKFFFVLTDSLKLEKRNKDSSYNIISSTKIAKPLKDICFDGMYVWRVEEDKIIKSINDDNLTEISKYNIPYQDIEYIGCDGYDIYYYTRSKIYHSTTDNPSVTDRYIISPDKKIISFDYKDNRIRYIYQENKNSYYNEIKILKGSPR